MADAKDLRKAKRESSEYAMPEAARALIEAGKKGICYNCESGKFCINAAKSAPVWYCNEYA